MTTDFTIAHAFLCAAVFFGFVFGSDTELKSLLEFKKGIKDPLGRVYGSWSRSSVVDPRDCPVSWKGVDCNDAGNVSSLSLYGLGLAGDLKLVTLNGLRMLRRLNLSRNSFTGRLVPSLGLLSTLESLDLSDNGFYGPIPLQIFNLWNLQYLNLSMNRFEGWLPGGMLNMQQLRCLDLRLNRLTGDIGGILSELKSVEFVDLSFNTFSGSLGVDPANISGFAYVVHYINFSNNNLNGEFFKADVVLLFRNLEVLDLSYNKLTGRLPSLISLSNLRIMSLASNRLFGPVPEELLQGMAPLQHLDLSDNGFTGSVDQINIPNLRVMNLSSNRISGSLPSSLGGHVVDLSKNIISGNISVLQTWWNLEILDLSSNSLMGTFPNMSSWFDNISYINIRNNSLSGNIPPSIGTYPKLNLVDLSLNRLDGYIPQSFFRSVNLIRLNLSRNHFTGTIPLDGSHESQLLDLSFSGLMEDLDLSNNFLTGGLSSGIGGMKNLSLLNLSSNILSGQIPDELSELVALKYLDLSLNNFSGYIPVNLPQLDEFNVSNNDLSGSIPQNLKKFPMSSFHPGNFMLIIPNDFFPSQGPGYFHGKHHHSFVSVRVTVAVASVGLTMMIVFMMLAYYGIRYQQLHGRNGFFCGHSFGRETKLVRFTRPGLLKLHVDQPSTNLGFSNDHLLTPNSRSLSANTEFVNEIMEHSVSDNTPTTSGALTKVSDNLPTTFVEKYSTCSSTSTSHHCFDTLEQRPMMSETHSPDRLVGHIFFLDDSPKFSVEHLSAAPAEVMGRSSHGTLYKATLYNGYAFTVKWLRVGLVKHKKVFTKEVRRIGSMRHPNLVPLRACYWGPREQERLLLADYIHGESLALHLHERRDPRLTLDRRVRVAVEVAKALAHLHDRGLPHGNLKPANIILSSPDLGAHLTDYGLHRLMTSPAVSEMMLNQGALGYGAPEQATAVKPEPSVKADVYALGVVLMELVTGRSAGDIISGQAGAVDLPDWVRGCEEEGRGADCYERGVCDGGEETMDQLLRVSLSCVLPPDQRPTITPVLARLSSLSLS